MVTIAEQVLFERYRDEVEVIRSDRVYYKVGDKLLIPKTVWLGVVKVYPNELKNKDAYFFICNGERRDEPKIIKVEDVLRVTETGKLIVDGVTFVYVTKAKKKGEKVRVSVFLPESTYKKILELIDKGGFKDEGEVIRVAVEHLYRRRRRFVL